MQVTKFVANQLKFQRFTEDPPYATTNGVTIVDVQADIGFFRIQLVRESQSINVKLEEGSKLAAFYNSRFWHELVTAKKIDLKTARFLTSFQVADSETNENHSIYVTSHRRGQPKNELNLDELEQAATQIAQLHALNPTIVNNQFTTAVKENFQNIRVYKNRILNELCSILQLSLSNELSKYFHNPNNIMEKLHLLVDHLKATNSFSQDEEEFPVIVHGKLTSESMRFDSSGNLVEITEWENIHLGNPAEDLTHLIVSSASKEVRQKKFMKIFHKYFYTLVDIKPPKYQLPHLKRWFKQFQAKSVIDGIERLLLILSESENEQHKYDSAHRWESALEDSFDFVTGNYMSDDEQVFFST